jgi:hypothetical protein
MKPKVQKATGAQKSYVVAGATLKCNQGDKQSKLKLAAHHRVYIKGIPQANINDFKPNVNVLPFGMCKSMSNPAVAAATAANKGRLKKMPCTPVLTMPWINGKEDKTVAGAPALLNKSTQMCLYCGRITIKNDGQNAGNANRSNSQPNKTARSKNRSATKSTCTIGPAPPPVRYEKDPNALAEDKGNIVVDGKKYPVYVPEFHNGSNAVYKRDGWSVIKTKHVTSTDTDWLGVIANYNCDQMIDSSNMSNINIRNYCFLNLILGCLQAYNSNTKKTNIHIEILKKRDKYRAIIQYGTSNTVLQTKAGLPYYYSDLKSTVEINGSSHGKEEVQKIIKEYFHFKDNKTYDIKVNLDSNHANDPYLGYLAIVNGKIMFVPKLYKKDNADLGHFSGLLGLLWENDMNLRYEMAKSTKIPDVTINDINKIAAPAIKLIQ